jgi:hypothetical protein
MSCFEHQWSKPRRMRVDFILGFYPTFIHIFFLFKKDEI